MKILNGYAIVKKTNGLIVTGVCTGEIYGRPSRIEFILVEKVNGRYAKILLSDIEKIEYDRQ